MSEDRFVASNRTYTAGQVSQQQAIYDKQQATYEQITNLTVRTLLFVLSITLMIGPVIKSSFNILLRIHEVTQISELVAIFADAWTEVDAVEEQAGFRYGTARSIVLAGRRR